MAAKKKRKWEGFKGQLPQWLGDEPSYIEKVGGLKKDYAKLTDVELAEKARDLKEKKQEKEDEVKELNPQIDAALGLLAERFEASGQQSLKLKSGHNFFLSDEPYAKIVDKAAIKEWLEENKQAEMLSPVWQSLNALVKERLEASLPPPKGVDVYMKTTVNMRKS